MTWMGWSLDYLDFILAMRALGRLAALRAHSTVRVPACPGTKGALLLFGLNGPRVLSTSQGALRGADRHRRLAVPSRRQSANDSEQDNPRHTSGPTPCPS